MINGELCELVFSFESLRPGDVIYDADCEACGRAWCREMLTVLVEGVDIGVYMGVPHPCWKFVPDCDPTNDGTFSAIGPREVREGRVYRVILEAPENSVAYSNQLHRRPERVE